MREYRSCSLMKLNLTGTTAYQYEKCCFSIDAASALKLKRSDNLNVVTDSL